MSGDPATSSERFPSVSVLGVCLHDVSQDELLRSLDHGVVFTPNVDIILRARKDPEFFRVLHQADVLTCDSRIVQLAARFLGTPIREKISGSDFFPAFCRHHQQSSDVRIFLLGAMEGVAAKAMANINQRAGRELVVAAHSPSYGFERNEGECREIIELINRSGATVLAVGVGAPKQEKWIMRWRDQLPAIRIYMGIGATIDFEAGNVSRAPRWMSNAGLEWLYRLLQEPKRLWRRYLLENPPFLWLVLKQRLGLNVDIRFPQS